MPTYVEAGAADLGITGKDVLLEQSGYARDDGARQLYELLDLGYGRCVMVLATIAGPDPAAEALRRLGVMRVATKYPRIAAHHLEETGRQAEIVEVKGSVELAPLAGLAEAIVDLTATGTTLRENNLVDPRGIEVCTARLIANPWRTSSRPPRSTTCSPACAPARPSEVVRIERLGLADMARAAPRASPRACGRWSRRRLGRPGGGRDHRTRARRGRRRARGVFRPL